MLHLGKKPARKNAVALAFLDYFRPADLPAPPLVFGKPGLVTRWGVLANDRAGDCVWAGAAHETQLWNAEADKPAPPFTDDVVLADYSAVTGYDPRRPETDGGTDMQQAAAYRRGTGVMDAVGVRHKIDAYVALKAGNMDQLALATYLLGAVGIGFLFPKTAFEQFDRAEPWDVVPHDPTEGGHYVSIVGRNSHGNFLVVTWGRLHAATPAFLERYMDEGLAYLSLEMFRGKLTRRGFDVEKLRADLATLGRR